MTNERTIPGSLVEGVFHKLLASELTPEVVALLEEAGIDVHRPVAASYPRPVWYRGIELAAAALFPSPEEDHRFRRLGSHLIERLQARGLKGPWLSMARLLGPRRAIMRAAEWAEKHSPVHFEVLERGKSEIEVRADEGAQPAFLAGLLEGLVTMLGGREPQARVTSATSDLAVFLVTWR